MAIVAQLKILGHATNAELLASLQQSFPTLSATTVHRATARLAQRGDIAIAPPNTAGAMRYDAQTTPHDHFVCTGCGRLRDVDIAHHVKPLLEAAIQGCTPSGRLTISGLCKLCTERETA